MNSKEKFVVVKMPPVSEQNEKMVITEGSGAIRFEKKIRYASIFSRFIE